MTIDIKVPTLGESVTEATVAKWFKAAGDQVAADEPLVELETDKVTLEVPSPAAGKVESIAAQEGATVEVNALLGSIAEGEAGEVAAPPAPAPQPGPAPAPAPTPAPVQAAPPPAPAPQAAAAALSPAVRNLVAENDLDPSQISATGKDGRLLKGDVLAHIQKGAAAPSLATPFTSEARAAVAGPREERVAMTRIRQRIAEHLKQAQNTAAMLTTFNEVDMSAVIALRKQYGTNTRNVTGSGWASCLFSSRPRSSPCAKSPRSMRKSTERTLSTKTITTSALPWARPGAWWCRWSITLTK